ncbi:GNAT family N-acetyltransferase [Planococcus kocurii]|uniref:GNAT family acetyltransferase n=1 Tax=Planococcus kocurii TaxID=1374 RepID=A0ABM5WZR8_9BACL|nr:MULTISPECIES: GNAT family N-acetyltransferase [Planococcus]ALS79854.1 GNAT family acetyltransferase [Planococcus kocurii]KAA0957265.1 GNAT family N-acetyltransferase [Planococcus sp. ANT_H30]
MTVEIKEIQDLKAMDVSKLVEESEAEGYRFLRRLVDQYEDGSNTFNKTAEVLYGVWDHQDHLVAIGGLNRDPYSSKESVGRLRRFYISTNARRQGIGTKLLQKIIEDAKGHFHELVVRTDSSAADAFYRANGFSGDLGLPEATHGIVLEQEHRKKAE